MLAFEAAAPHIAFPIRLICRLANPPDSCLETHPAYAGSLKLCVDLAAGLRVEVPSLSDHRFSDPFAQFTGGQLSVGVR